MENNLLAFNILYVQKINIEMHIYTLHIHQLKIIFWIKVMGFLVNLF